MAAGFFLGGVGLALPPLSNPGAGLPLALIGAFLASRTQKVRFVFDEEAMEVMTVGAGGQSLSMERENFAVGGRNRWTYASFTNWEVRINRSFFLCDRARKMSRGCLSKYWNFCLLHSPPPLLQLYLHLGSPALPRLLPRHFPAVLPLRASACPGLFQRDADQARGTNPLLPRDWKPGQAPGKFQEVRAFAREMRDREGRTGAVGKQGGS